MDSYTRISSAGLVAFLPSRTQGFFALVASLLLLSSCADLALEPASIKRCGNGVLEEHEICDPKVPVTKTCAQIDEIYGSGTPTCTDYCYFNLENCEYKNPVVPKYPACGNGIVEGSETCDDGNFRNGDGCSSNCTLEPGYSCINREHLPTACSKIDNLCGNGVVDEGEECDVKIDPAHCTAQCKKI